MRAIDRLYETASTQAGLFTTAQARAAGYATSALTRLTHAGRFERRLHGLYRLRHFPFDPQEELIAAWLWSEQRGVLSHLTALDAHGLSHALPTKIHLTLPVADRRRRRRLPAGLVLHFADLTDDERTWVGLVPVTTVARTIRDCADAHVDDEIIERAIDGALERGLVTAGELARGVSALRGRS